MSMNHNTRPAAPRTYNAGVGEAEDFNAFHSPSGREDARRPQNRTRQQLRNQKMNVGLIAGIAAGVALIVIIAIIVIATVAGGGAISYEDNAYIAYADVNGNYYVSVNGAVLDHKFEGEVEVIPAADYSFAYVTDSTANGIHVYLLNGKKLQRVTGAAASEVLALASLRPGVVFKDEDKINLYSEEYGDDYRITKDISADHFVISGDATTVAYTVAAENSGGELQLCLFRDGMSDKIAKNCIPVAISNYGDYIYGHSKDESKSSLYVITTEDQEKYPIENSNGFDSVISMNVKGNELLFTTKTETNTYTHLYRHHKKNPETIKLAKGQLVPAIVDPTVAIPKTFAKSYFTGTVVTNDGLASTTYRLTKKFETVQIASSDGKFSPDGNYFYFINKDGGLTQIDLRDKDLPQIDVFKDDTLKFTVTEKGNVYILSKYKELYLYKLSENKKSRIDIEVTDIVFYNYANELYFAQAESDEPIVYITEEGSEGKIAKMDSTQLSSVPVFSTPALKRTYACYYDIDNGWTIFYTATGKRFKMISNDCQAINGVEIPDMAE